MKSKTTFQTDAAPQAIGAYSQAARAADGSALTFISGQIPLDPATGDMVGGGPADQVARVFDNLKAVCEAAGGSLDDIVKLTVYLADLADFSLVNAEMEKRFARPFPARAAIGVAALPKGARVEVEAVMQSAR